MKQDFIIRKFEKSDMEDLKGLALGLIQTQIEVNSLFRGLNIIRSIDIEEETNNSSCCIFVAEYNEELIGYSEVMLDKKNAWFEVEEHTLLVDLFVDKSKYENLDFYKIAFRLYKSCEDWAREHKMKYLCADVYGDNTRVRRLLAKRGFKEYKIKFVKDLSN